MPARVELYKEGDRLAILTNATNEYDFFESFCDLLGRMIEEDVYAGRDDNFEEDGPPLPHFGNDWDFQLRYWLPEMVDIVCKLRGYKNEVHESRLLVAGELTPGESYRVGANGPIFEKGLPPREEMTKA